MSTLATVIAKGLYSAIPTFGIPGRLYFATDTGLTWYDTGTAWVDITLGGSPGAGGTVLTSTGSTSAPTWQAGGGGGGRVQPVIRGTGLQSGSSTSFTVTWPTGTIEGDEVYIFAGSTGVQNIPAGWTVPTNMNVTGGSYNGTVMHRTLNAADITAGSVTVTNTFAAGNVVAVVAFEGQTGGLRPLSSSVVAGASSVETIVTDGAILTTDMVLLFVGGNVGTPPTCSLGTSEQSTSLAQLYALGPVAPGGISPAFTFTGTQCYVVVVVLQGAV